MGVRLDPFNGRDFEQVTAVKAQVKVTELMMTEYHFAAQAQGPELFIQAHCRTVINNWDA